MRRVYALSVFLFFLNTLMYAQINDIKSFLNQCPTKDPIVDTILKDFEIRLNGKIVTHVPNLYQQ
jgi:hypothetical protein